MIRPGPPIEPVVNTRTSNAHKVFHPDKPSSRNPMSNKVDINDSKPNDRNHYDVKYSYFVIVCHVSHVIGYLVLLMRNVRNL